MNNNCQEIDQKGKRKLGYVQGFLSLILNFLLFLIKYWVGIKSGSVAIIADAWHTISDSASSLVLIMGFRASGKPADSRHPYGHGRADIISSLIIGTLLGVIAFYFFKESIIKLYHRQLADYDRYAFWIFLLSLLLKEALARFAFWAGKKCNSRSLIADAWHHRSDALASLIILTGILLNHMYWWIDGVLGIIVSGFILQTTYSIMKNSISGLLGEEPEDGLKKRIIDKVNDVSGRDMQVHRIQIHDYGEHKEMTLHIVLPGDSNINEAYETIKKIEDMLFRDMGLNTNIRIEPES
jgi:cation diffusion facilitator family transporter